MYLNKEGFIDSLPIDNFQKQLIKDIIKDETRAANEFIKDIAELLGESDLGFDGKAWTIDDFKDAIERLKKDRSSKAN